MTAGRPVSKKWGTLSLLAFEASRWHRVQGTSVSQQSLSCSAKAAGV